MAAAYTKTWNPKAKVRVIQLLDETLTELVVNGMLLWVLTRSACSKYCGSQANPVLHLNGVDLSHRPWLRQRP